MYETYISCCGHPTSRDTCQVPQGLPETFTAAVVASLRALHWLRDRLPSPRWDSGARALQHRAQRGFFSFRHSCRNSGQKTRSQGTCNGFSDTSQHTGHMKWPRRLPSLRPRPCTGAAILLPDAQRDAAEKREPKGRGLQGAGPRALTT